MANPPMAGGRHIPLEGGQGGRFPGVDRGTSGRLTEQGSAWRKVVERASSFPHYYLGVTLAPDKGGVAPVSSGSQRRM
jgi:hypothetical protein